MAQSNRSTLVLVAMIIAAIYVIMLVGFTRSTYFIGGAAFERSAKASYALAAESRPVPAPMRSLCVALDAKLAEPRDCVLASQVPGRPPGLRAH